MTVKALALFSGGLDSILACRVMMRQGIDVQAIKFISPFFDYHILENIDGYRDRIRQKYGINVLPVDISKDYLKLLRAPRHGYGKHFNPCLDCKIFMISRARQMLPEFGASFLITGEVVGQRPMSQRRDALRVVARDSGCLSEQETGDVESILLRPLCAKNLTPTRPEIEGLVDRKQLYDFYGRTRNPQIELAAEFGITDYPSPAGGCILTDPVLGQRIKSFFSAHLDVNITDMRYIQLGRQFQLPHGSWLALGRKQAENELLEQLCDTDEKAQFRLKLEAKPGPTAVVYRLADKADLVPAAGLVARYGKKNAQGEIEPGQVVCERGGQEKEVILGTPPAQADIELWQR